jgi:hypothetical protein
MNIPYSFEAELEDGSKVCQGDKPLMIAEGSSDREIEQNILERLDQFSFVTNIRWCKMSDWNM